ncbi:MAG: phage-shock protein [Peptococcaceae bacterium]|nr:phage-shock protein [Peptococcaceae bacterium]
MNGNLHSLTDVLKRTLYFFEAMSAKDLAPYVRRKMLQDYTLEQVEQKVNLCLQQHECFYQNEQGLWCLNMEGNKENNQFYHQLLKKGAPMSLWDVYKSSQGKKKRLRRMIAQEGNLISDGRFIQLDNGTWGLTEWDVDAAQYPLKYLVIKVFRLHPGGLSLPQIVSVVNNWRPTTEASVEVILHNFPYFEKYSDNLWTYNHKVHRVYDDIMKKYLGILREQKKRWHSERNQWQQKYQRLKTQVNEAISAQKEAAAALAQQSVFKQQYDQLATQLSEKDLLLSLRKKEILHYQEQVRKLESKANSILHQCRLWVQRARDGEAENERLREALDAAQRNLETMFTKLQEYKEKYRVSQAKMAELKENHSTKVAELQGEIIELKNKLTKCQENAERKAKVWEEDIDRLQTDLKESLEAGEDLQRSVRFLQHELRRTREEYRRLEKKLRHPLVRWVAKLSVLVNR